jgi:hypothetical protein
MTRQRRTLVGDARPCSGAGTAWGAGENGLEPELAARARCVLCRPGLSMSAIVDVDVHVQIAFPADVLRNQCWWSCG